MNVGQYIFTQITSFLPQRQFRRIVQKYNDRTQGWSLSHWNHMLVLLFGQLIGCCSLRELTDITIAHGKKSFFLGFGKKAVNRQILSKANSIRDHRIFEEFAFYMVSIAQNLRLTKDFELHGRFYAVDSTTIDLCMSIFRWAKFRSTKSGIKIHTQVDIVTEIPVFYRITNAVIHDVNAMDWITYEPNACYVFDRGYFDLARLYAIHSSMAFFIIREKRRPEYEIVDGEELLDGEDNVLYDQTVRFTGKRNKSNYPGAIRRIVYFAPDLQRTFTYYQITSILLPRLLPGFIATDGKLSYSSNGSSSIFVSKPSGESPRMLLESKSMWQSSRIALLESLRGGSTSIAQSFKSCEYSAVRCSSKRTLLNCSSTLKKRRSRPMDS
ncbi:IS4 family transposase [Prevotella herbatica]